MSFKFKIIFLFCYLTMFLRIIPVKINLPEPTGKYSVGIKDFHFIDKSRTEKHNNHKNNRELMINCILSQQLVKSKKIKYAKDIINIIKNDILQEKNIGINNLNYLDEILIHSQEEIPISNDKNKYPIILFSPGFSSSSFFVYHTT